MWCHFGISSKSSIAFSGRSSCFNAVCPAKSSYAMYSKTNETNPEGNNLRDSYLLSGSDSSVILGGHGTNTNPNKKNYPGSDSSVMVEIVGIEPMTSWMPFKRSTNWAISPYVFWAMRRTNLRGIASAQVFRFFAFPITRLWWRRRGSLLRRRRSQCRHRDRSDTEYRPEKSRLRGKYPRKRRRRCNLPKFYVPWHSTSK